MRLPPRLVAPAAFLVAAGLAVLAALWAAGVIESRTAQSVKSLMTREGLSWVEVETDGLQVRLSGTAPNEALRFRAMNLTGSLVDSSRIRDEMDVIPARAIAPPRFSVELLRNDDGISLIGLVPSVDGETTLADEVAAIASGARIADMLTEADFPAPQGWDAAVDFGLTALRMLPRSKISIEAGRVTITAISGSAEEKRRYEADLASARPDGVIVALDISAPRPVLTPFTLRFVKDDRGARFDACSADTEAARDPSPCRCGQGGRDRHARLHHRPRRADAPLGRGGGTGNRRRQPDRQRQHHLLGCRRDPAGHRRNAAGDLRPRGGRVADSPAGCLLAEGHAAGEAEKRRRGSGRVHRHPVAGRPGAAARPPDRRRCNAMPSPALPGPSSAPGPSTPPRGSTPTCPMAGRSACWPGCRRCRNSPKAP